nr:arsenite resistance protein 2 [Hymenolepis microstoma]
MDTNDQKDASMIETIQKKESAVYLKPAFGLKMMSVSKFLEPFDDTSLTDEDAAQKYSAYVSVFLKEQLNEQFEHNKSYAWFRDKYHPDHVVSKEKERETLLARFCIFKKMWEGGLLNNIPLEYKERTAVAKLLDQFAILFAGGTFDDLADLESFDPSSTMGDLVNDTKPFFQPEPEGTKLHRRSLSPKSPKQTGKKETSKRQKKSRDNAKRIKHDDGNSSDSSSSNSSRSSSSGSSSGSSSRSSSSHSTSSSSSSSSSSSDASSSSGSVNSKRSKTFKQSKTKELEVEENVKIEGKSEQEDVNVEMKEGVSVTCEAMEVAEVENQTVAIQLKKEVKPPKTPLHATRVIYLPYLPLSIHRSTLETLLSDHPDYLRFACLEPTPLPSSTLNVSDSTTSSLLLHRPAWITFTPVPSECSLPIMDFIHQLISRLRVDCATNETSSEASDLAAALQAARLLPSAFNIDRIRASTRLARTLMATVANNKSSYNPISSKSVMRKHLVMAARLAARLDEIWGLWREPYDAETADWPIPKATDLDPRRGAILADLVDLGTRTDESSAEEELLLTSRASTTKIDDTSTSKEANFELVRALDMLIIYLRLVYSIDFYSPALYFRESDMPHPCSVFHIRPSKIPESIAANTFHLLRLMPPAPGTVFGKEPTEKSAHKIFARQISRIFRMVTPLSIGTITNVKEMEPSLEENQDITKSQRIMDPNETRLRLLGYRDVNEVTEEFIKANTKRKKRKVDVIWICPLSDKKFRGPAFVRKHILNKHIDKIEAEKKEKAYFFNNYLLDPMRPELMHPPRRHLPIHLRRAVSVDNENEDDDVVLNRSSPRQRKLSPRGVGGRENFQSASAGRYRGNNRGHNNGYGNYGSGGRGGATSFGNGPRRYWRPNNPWSGGAGYYRPGGGNRVNSYRDLDAPN